MHGIWPACQSELGVSVEDMKERQVIFKATVAKEASAMRGSYISMHCATLLFIVVGCDSPRLEQPVSVPKPVVKAEQPAAVTPPPRFRKEIFMNAVRAASGIKPGDQASVESLLTEIKFLSLQSPSDRESNVIKMLAGVAKSESELNNLARLEKDSKDSGKAFLLLKDGFKGQPVSEVYDEIIEMAGKGCIIVGSGFAKILPLSDARRKALEEMGMQIIQGGKGGFYIDYNAAVLMRKTLSSTLLSSAAEEINKSQE